MFPKEALWVFFVFFFFFPLLLSSVCDITTKSPTILIVVQPTDSSDYWQAWQRLDRRANAPPPFPPLEIDVYTQVSCKQREKKKKNEENLIVFRTMFQDDINLMDGEHMECMLGHQRRQFEVKPRSANLVGQQKPSS